MSSWSASPSLIARLGAALAQADPEDALAAGLALLRELGLVPHDSARGTPWLELSDRGRTVALDAPAGAPDPALCDAIGGLLALALARLADRDEHRRVRERMDMLSEASFEGIMIHVDGVVIDANARLAEMLGCAPAEVLGPTTLRSCVAPEDLPDVLRRMRERLEGEYVITGVRKDGSRFRAELLSKQGHLGERPVRVVAVRDVTERERTARMLRESEARLRDLAEQAFDFTILSREGVVIGAGGALERVLGFKPEQIVGWRLLDLVAPSSVPLAVEVIAEQRVGSFHVVLKAAGGEPVPVEVVAVTSTLDGEPVRVAGLRDMRAARRLEAERRKLEQQLERSQRLESLGVLAGGIAHDFNNLLVGVLGNADLLRQRLADPLDREAAESVVAAAERAASLTRQMLAYAGQAGLERREPIDLGALWRELRVLLGATLSKKAHVELSIAPRSVVLGDRATLTQLLMNLLTNASDALEGKEGRIDVRTRRLHQPDARWEDALGAAVRPGDWVLVEVADTGVGMDDTTRGRLFEPFFTTKQHGHGLGLAASLGIVSSHGGALLVESVRGKGSCFSVLLPASEPASEPSLAGQRPVPEAVRTLVVDDEPLVRAQLRRSLVRQGYPVEEAADGRAALAAIERGGIGLVILDMTMPDFDGAEVVRRLRASGSRVPIVVSSGYLDATVEHRLAPGTFQAFLPKPYTLAELFEAIARALAA